MEWYTSTLPPKRHEQLTLALACRVATDNLSKQPCRAVNKGAAQSLTGIPEHGVRKAEARALIVNAVQHACEQGAAAPSVVMEDFAALFRKQQAPVPAWVYETLRGVSRCSIRLWIQQANKGGVRRLAKQHERRAPRNLVAQCPTLERFLVGMIEEFPHTSAVGLHEAAHARFGASGTAPDPAIKIPSVRRMQAWLRKWKEENEQLYSHILNPDAWRSGHKLALGDAAAHVVALNQEWQADSTQCDLMLNDGQRHTIVAMIDVYSRRVRFHVSRTSSAAAVASCFRKALLDWGVPDTLKTDNGSDYVSNHMKRIIHFLDIEHDVCPPFTPEHKPHVERVFKTFLHSHVELMQGYIGHNVAQRSDIEARKSFADRLFKKMQDREARVELAVSPEELQRICDAWAEAKYGNTVHGGLKGRTPNQKAAAYNGPVYRIEDERALDVLLLPCPGNNGLRIVSKKGIRLTSKVHGFSLGGHYIGADLGPLQGREVLVRMDDTDLGRIYLFAPESHEYLGKAENPGLLGWSTEQVREVAVNAVRNQKTFIRKARKQTKAADVKNIANEILQAAIRQNADRPKAPEQTVAFVNKNLEQAARTFTGDFTPPTEAQQEQAMAAVAHLLHPRAKGFAVPEGKQARMEYWRELYDKAAAGALLTPDEQHWFASFGNSYECKAYCKIHGLPLLEAKYQ